MEYLLTSEQMRLADAYTIEELGVSSLLLMERAGCALADAVQEMMALKGKKIRLRVLCVCGGGNNGGDGFVCARILRERGVDTDVVFFAEKTSGDCAVNKEKFLQSGGKILNAVPSGGYDYIVDCLLGTGFKGVLKEPVQSAVIAVNQLKDAGAKVLSADMPTGVNGDNGRVEGVAIRADETVCIGEKKAGVYLADGIDYSGRVSRADIGICLNGDDYAVRVDRECVREILPKRKRNTHKGSYGKTAIVAGSEAFSGAGLLTTLACLRAGAGYTTLFLPKALFSAFLLQAPEALLSVLCDGGRVAFNEKSFSQLLAFDCVAYGPGLGESEDVALGAEYLLSSYTGKLVLDADALNSLAKYRKEQLIKLFENKRCQVVLTPHLKEFSRLCGWSVEQIVEKGLYAPVEFAKQTKSVVILKSAVSILSDGERVFVNTTGTAGQAKGGSGDVLTGVVAGLCGAGLSAMDGAKAGAYLCGKAGEIATQKQGEYSVIARDIIDCLGEAFRSLFAEDADEQGKEQ